LSISTRIISEVKSLRVIDSFGGRRRALSSSWLRLFFRLNRRRFLSQTGWYKGKGDQQREDN
jgi:hypothetical protein